MTTAGIKLTDEQSAAVDLAVSGIKTLRPMTKIGGYAGTGKTTLIHAILEAVDTRVGVVAYTGKAACVLRDKGLRGASTIHSLIYSLEEMEERHPVTGKLEPVRRWMRKPHEDITADAFIIDEASMVGKEILDDLTSYGLPVIAVGDPGQLPPVSKHDVNLMDKPDFVLSKIHRQAEGSGIIRLATEIREGGRSFIKNSMRALVSEDVVIAPKTEVRHDPDADVFICGYNRTRSNLNTICRRRRGFTDPVVNGERIICLSNDRNLGVFNGLMGTVVEVGCTHPRKLHPRGREPIELTGYDLMVLWDSEAEPRQTVVSSYGFGSAQVDWEVAAAHFNDMVIADHGYAITCHKSQGSQWDSVVVMNEWAPKIWDQARWLYTAVTRAAKTLALGHENG